MLHGYAFTFPIYIRLRLPRTRLRLPGWFPFVTPHALRTRTTVTLVTLVLTRLYVAVTTRFFTHYTCVAHRGWTLRLPFTVRLRLDCGYRYHIAVTTRLRLPFPVVRSVLRVPPLRVWLLCYRLRLFARPRYVCRHAILRLLRAPRFTVWILPHFCATTFHGWLRFYAVPTADYRSTPPLFAVLVLPPFCRPAVHTAVTTARLRYAGSPHLQLSGLRFCHTVWLRSLPLQLHGYVCRTYTPHCSWLYRTRFTLPAFCTLLLQFVRCSAAYVLGCSSWFTVYTYARVRAVGCGRLRLVYPVPPRFGSPHGYTYVPVGYALHGLVTTFTAFCVTTGLPHLLVVGLRLRAVTFWIAWLPVWFTTLQFGWLRWVLVVYLPGCGFSLPQLHTPHLYCLDYILVRYCCWFTTTYHLPLLPVYTHILYRLYRYTFTARAVHAPYTVLRCLYGYTTFATPRLVTTTHGWLPTFADPLPWLDLPQFPFWITCYRLPFITLPRFPVGFAATAHRGWFFLVVVTHGCIPHTGLVPFVTVRCSSATFGSVARCVAHGLPVATLPVGFCQLFLRFYVHRTWLGCYRFIYYTGYGWLCWLRILRSFGWFVPRLHLLFTRCHTLSCLPPLHYGYYVLTCRLLPVGCRYGLRGLHGWLPLFGCVTPDCGYILPALPFGYGCLDSTRCSPHGYGCCR